MKKLAVANGTYQKDGQEKTRWVNIGIINTTNEGKEYMLIDPTINFAAFPRQEGKDMVMVGVFEEQNNNNGNGQQSYNNNQQQNNNSQPQDGYNPQHQQNNGNQQNNNGNSRGNY